MPTPPTIAEQPPELHQDSADRVNRHVAEDRQDLVRELTDRFTEEALRLILASQRQRHPVFSPYRKRVLS